MRLREYVAEDDIEKGDLVWLVGNRAYKVLPKEEKPKESWCECPEPKEDLFDRVHPNHCVYCHLPIKESWCECEEPSDVGLCGEHFCEECNKPIKPNGLADSPQRKCELPEKWNEVKTTYDMHDIVSSMTVLKSYQNKIIDVVNEHLSASQRDKKEKK